MEFINIKNYEHYQLFENGKIYNTKTKNYINGTINKNNQHQVKLTLNGITKSFTLSRLIYFYNIKLTDNEIIIFIDGNDKNFHYKNLKKINRTDMFKVENHQELDKNKEWKINKDYPDYKISNYGDIFSIKSNKILKTRKNFHKYFIIKLINKNNERNELMVHRLVYDTFKILSGNNNLVIDHIDRNPSNNYIDNLKEVTQKENLLNRNIGEVNKNKIIQYSLDNKFIKEWNCLDEIKNELKIKSTSLISMCCMGKRKTAYNFIWKNLSKIEEIGDFREIISNNNKTYLKYKINSEGIIINKNNIILKPKIEYGYKVVGLTSDDGIKNNFKVHRLVAMTFIDNPNKYNIVNHIDENKLNNNVENLEWCNHKQNITHSQGKKVNQIDMETNKIIKTFDSVCDAFRELNKNYGANIRWACEGKRKFAFGYKWEFI